MKVVINVRCGGFSLSDTAVRRLEELSGQVNTWIYLMSLSRSDNNLVQVVEELGVRAASGDYAALKIVEIPDNIQWYVDMGDDGREEIHEVHQRWS